MSCMTAIIARSPLGLNLSVDRIHSVTADMCLDTLDIVSNIRREHLRIIPVITANRIEVTPRVRYVSSNIKLGVTLTCSVSRKEPPYLEIEPEILWVWEIPVDNNVYSNTDWFVD